MAGLPSSRRDAMTWGTMLDQESEDISLRARQLFRRAKASLRSGSGHTISGIDGNDKALACVCLCLVKIKLPGCNRKSVETSLQRTSGVLPRIFSKALKELPLILQSGTNNASPFPKSPTKQHAIQSKGLKDIAGGSSVSKGKETKSVGQESRDSLVKSSRKRVAIVEFDEEDELLLTPSTKKKMRVSEKLSPPKPTTTTTGLDSDAQTPRPTPIFEQHNNNTTTTRSVIHKTPLNLPINNPPKPLCIFHSQPILNPLKLSKPPYLDFTDWNWKFDLFHNHWSLHDIHEWEKWNKKSFESSLS